MEWLTGFFGFGVFSIWLFGLGFLFLLLLLFVCCFCLVFCLFGWGLREFDLVVSWWGFFAVIYFGVFF